MIKTKEVLIITFIVIVINNLKIRDIYDIHIHVYVYTLYIYVRVWVYRKREKYISTFY